MVFIFGIRIQPFFFLSGKSNLICPLVLSRYSAAEKNFPALDLKPLIRGVRPLVRISVICETVSFFLQISKCI